MHHTLQVPPAVGCCHLTFCMWLQVPVGFFRIPAPPSAFSSHACLLHREFLSALLLLPHRSECYCLLLGASLMVGVERSCPFGLVSVLCRPSEAVISHCSCQPPPPNVNKTPPCMRENMSGEGESFVPCSQWQEISEQGSLTFPSGKKSLLLLLQKQWLSAWA